MDWLLAADDLVHAGLADAGRRGDLVEAAPEFLGGDDAAAELLVGLLEVLLRLDASGAGLFHELEGAFLQA